MIVKMILLLLLLHDPKSREKNGGKGWKMQEMLTKDLEELKNKQTEMNNTLEGIYSRITEAEEWINDLEDRMVETASATQEDIKKRWKEMKTDWDL